MLTGGAISVNWDSAISVVEQNFIHKSVLIIMLQLGRAKSIYVHIVNIRGQDANVFAATTVFVMPVANKRLSNMEPTLIKHYAAAQCDSAF
jgi:hypothetical protein